jgi:hypothetical protein
VQIANQLRSSRSINDGIPSMKNRSSMKVSDQHCGNVDLKWDFNKGEE